MDIYLDSHTTPAPVRRASGDQAKQGAHNCKGTPVRDTPDHAWTVKIP